MKTSLWRGLSAVMAFLLLLSIFGGQIANNNAGGINNFLGISASQVSSSGGRFASSYGELSDESLARLIADEDAFCIEQLEEGAVLLKNNGVLPLDASVKKVSLFGHASANIRYRNANGGGQADPAREINLKKAFTDAGFEVNDTLFDAYATSQVTYVKSGNETEETGEDPISFYTDKIKDSFSQYADAAVVVLYRAGGESTDMSKKNAEGIPSLALQPNERDMLALIRDSGAFSKVIVLVNSVYPLELGWLDEYKVDACLWMGNPGYYGLPGVVNILTGKANPSGRLVATYATDSLSSAAVQNFGEFRFKDADGVPTYQNRFVVYQEGIYVGYKYYETRYEDTVLGQGNADGDAGIFASQGGKWSYADEIVFPFGYGLSYTTFDQTLDSVDYNAANDTMRVSVTVKNTGSKAGKVPVQIYVQTPYTDYDREHHVEKAAIQLLAYGKTGVIEPGKSETVKLELKRYLMASYDTTAHGGQGGYILDGGDYYIAVGDNAHDALNNVLAAKGASGMVDQDGNPAAGKAANAKIYHLDSLDDTTYLKSRYTNVEVHNLFDYANANYYYDDAPVTYLSRADWQGTWSNGETLAMNDKLKEALKTGTYEKDEAVPAPVKGEDYAVEGTLTLADMIGSEYDDPRWENLVKQLSLSDIGALTSEFYGQSPVDSIGKPSTVTSEGSEGTSQRYKFGDGNIATGYASNTLMAASWNESVQRRYGEFVGEDALFAGVHTIHGPGADTHRTPFSGRAAEYFSEDSVISWNVGDVMNTAMAGKGLVNNFKHFFLNDQEYDRQGVATFANEQAIREIYLRAFEGGVTGKGGIGMMTSYNRIGPVYCAADPVVHFKLLREEWGYQGYTMTDYIAEGDYAVTADMMMRGTNIYGGNDRSKSLQRLISRKKDSALLKAAQESAHRVLWTYTRSSMMNLIAPETETETAAPAASYSNFVAWWQYVLMGLQGFFGLLTLISLALYVKNAYFVKKQKR